jgi:hypothetical protein
VLGANTRTDDRHENATMETISNNIAATTQAQFNLTMWWTPSAIVERSEYTATAAPTTMAIMIAARSADFHRFGLPEGGTIS